MGRYRAPVPPSSKCITRAGFQRLQSELAFLLNTKRPEVTASVAAAAAQGDRSENAEYIYGKKQLREIDARIYFLHKRLQNIKVLENRSTTNNKVCFGDWVRIASAQGNESYVRIVGPDEFDADRHWISMDSPLARALLDKTIGDACVVELPSRLETYTIISIDYDEFKQTE